MPCPKCGGVNFVLGGTYKIARSVRLNQRLKCRDCKTTFTVRTKSFGKKIPLDTRKKIIALYKTKKPYKIKFDSLRKSTYSTREIAKKLNVSKSFVYNVIKESEIVNYPSLNHKNGSRKGLG